MSGLIFHWLVCRISDKLKLKRFYDHVSRPFDCSLDVGCQRSIPSIQIVHVLSLVAMIAIKTHHCLSSYFLTNQSGTLIVVIVTSPPSAHLTLRNVVCMHKHNGIVTN